MFQSLSSPEGAGNSRWINGHLYKIWLFQSLSSPEGAGNLHFICLEYSVRMFQSLSSPEGAGNNSVHPPKKEWFAVSIPFISRRSRELPLGE
ncbi:Uncharacterized protein dnm_080370 [Desulfonema magnum]|uniref:Uncharacterized protein n=1 Tax=Desulfonema magnum TaxID=45655 RepID=A0A975GSF0_9BACT|nr:Uncharacterized protein dnm_080370 [Desulfonema magnum]